MSRLLYLDTARLGQMSAQARRASVDFARFASEYGGSLYSTDFLRHGSESLPSNISSSFPGLSTWAGVDAMKDNVRHLCDARPGSKVLVAARSAVLMKFTARLMFGPCRNVLLTDLTWPVYERIIRRQQLRSRCHLTRISVRRSILFGGATGEDLVARIAQSFISNGCDGLFLPLVDSHGIHLPIGNIVERLKSHTEVRFVGVDGAQALNHVPLDLASDYCDFLVTGCHKWLRAHTPMGLGFYGHPRSVAYINDSLRRWTDRGVIDDPLLAFTNELTAAQQNAFGETVAVAPMITANGAAIDALEAKPDPDAGHANRNSLYRAASSRGWQPIVPTEMLQSRIDLFRSDHSLDRGLSAEDLKRQFLNRGVALSAYDGGLIRTSLPDGLFTVPELQTLETAFQR